MDAANYGPLTYTGQIWRYIYEASYHILIQGYLN